MFNFRLCLFSCFVFISSGLCILCFVLFCVLFIALYIALSYFCTSIPTTATGWKPNCSKQISYHIISYHIISYHIISYHIISYHIISYHIISYHIISYHIISYIILFSFHKSVQDYIIHMDMEIIIFVGIKR